MDNSVASSCQIIRQPEEKLRLSQLPSCIFSLLRQLLHQGLTLLQAQEGDEGGFSILRIRAYRFSQHLGGAGHIQNIIPNLEGHA